MKIEDHKIEDAASWDKLIRKVWGINFRANAACVSRIVRSRRIRRAWATLKLRRLPIPHFAQDFANQDADDGLYVAQGEIGQNSTCLIAPSKPHTGSCQPHANSSTRARASTSAEGIHRSLLNAGRHPHGGNLSNLARKSIVLVVHRTQSDRPPGSHGHAHEGPVAQKLWSTLSDCVNCYKRHNRRRSDQPAETFSADTPRFDIFSPPHGETDLIIQVEQLVPIRRR